MIRIYRDPTPGEFFCVFVDCAQGGIDSNFGQFLSKSKLDVPLVYEAKGVAANSTPVIHDLLEWLYDKTKIQPVVAFERNMGGSSELERLRVMNRQEKYRIFTEKSVGTDQGEQMTHKMGMTTTSSTRPKMLGDLKQAIDSRTITIYDEETSKQLRSFIVTKQNRAEAASNAHDDAVMSLAGAWQLYQTENPITKHKASKTYSGGMPLPFGRR